MIKNIQVSVDFLQSFADAFNAHDIHAIMGHMTEDCIFEASAGPDIDGEKSTGQPAVKKAFEEVFQTLRMHNGEIPDISYQVTADFQNGYSQVQRLMVHVLKLPDVIYSLSGMEKLL